LKLNDFIYILYYTFSDKYRLLTLKNKDIELIVALS